MFEKRIHKVRMNQNKFCLNKKMPMEKTFLPNIKTLVKCEVLFHSLSNDLKKNITSLILTKSFIKYKYKNFSKCN